MTKEEFLEALGKLTVEKKVAEDVCVITINTSVFGQTQDLVFTLKKESHELIVNRPPGITRTSSKFWSQQSMEYNWNGGVGSAKGNTPPVHVKKWGDNSLIERLYNAPVHGVLRYRGKSEGFWPNTLGSEIDKTADKLWSQVWKELYPELDERAAAITEQFSHPWHIYKLLIERRDLCEIAEKYPGIAPRMRKVNEDLSEDSVLRELTGYSRQIRDEDGKYTSTSFGDGEFFKAWAQNVPMGEGVIPNFHLPSEKHYKHNKKVSDKEWELIMKVADAEENKNLRPEDIKKLETPTQWLLFHTMIVNHMSPGPVLQAPEKAEAAFLKTYTENKPFAFRAAKAVEDIRERMIEDKSIERQSAKWAEKYNAPELKLEVHDENASFSQNLRRVRRGRLFLSQAKIMGSGFTPTSEGSYILYANPEQARQLIKAGSLDEKKLAPYLIARSAMRRDSEILDFIIEHNENSHAFVKILEDRHIAGKKRIWKKLMEFSPMHALKYLEENGFSSSEEWTAEDLSPFFKKGRELALRATILLSDLRDMQVGQVQNEEEEIQKGLVQKELFPSMLKGRS